MSYRPNFFFVHVSDNIKHAKQDDAISSSRHVTEIPKKIHSGSTRPRGAEPRISRPVDALEKRKALLSSAPRWTNMRAFAHVGQRAPYLGRRRVLKRFKRAVCKQSI